LISSELCQLHVGQNSGDRCVHCCW